MKKITFLIILLCTVSVFSQTITVTQANTTSNTVQHIVQDILIDSPCALVSNFQTQGLCGVGNFNYAGTTSFFSGGMILRCGDVNNSAGIYDGSNMSSTCSNAGDAQLAAISQANGNPGTINDVTYVKFDFTPLTDSFSFNFVFASNEYGTYQCGFSDVFAFILTDLTTGTITNLAVIPGTTTPVSVTNIRDIAFNAGCPSVNPEYFDTFNPDDPPSSIMNMRGFTVPMTAFANVIPNNPYSIKLAIGDYNDTAFDSAVFIEAGSFNVGTANLSYPVGVGVETDDMTIANGLAPCPGEIRTLDTGLNAGSYDFLWSLDIGDGNGPVPISGETGPTLDISQPGEYCVQASNVGGGGSCTQVDCIIVEYQDGFEINNSPNDLYSCNNNFNLDDNAATILGGLDPNEYDLTFYATMQDAINAFPQISSNQTTSQTTTVFYAAVENFNFTCRQFAQFNAVVSPCQPTQPSDMVTCDDITNDGVEPFDLTTQDGAILNGLDPTQFTITYHTTLVGAQTETNLANPQGAYVGGPNQTIYVRMESNNDPTQFNTTTFQIIVLPLPTAAIGTSTICQGQAGVVTFSGTPGATVNYTFDDGTNGPLPQTPIVLDGTGNASITTPVLVANATYALVDVTSVDNCTRLVNGTATVTVLPLPDVSISTTTSMICDGTVGTVDFVGTPGATVSYTVDGLASSLVLDGSGNGSDTTTTTSTFCLVSVTSNTNPSCSQSFTDCVTITVIPLPTVSITGDTICDGDTAIVTFTGTPDASVNYTFDDGSSVVPGSVTLNPSGTQTVTSTVAGVYTLVDVTSNTNPACTQVVNGSASVVVLNSPPVNPITDIHVCDDNNDCFATFDLSSAVSEAQGGDATLTVTIHETQTDADFNSNPITNITGYQNIDPCTQVLYVRIENAGGCYSTSTFSIIVDARPELNQNVASYEQCDYNNPGDGIEVFDLTNATTTADITGGVTGLTLTYYESLADAQVPQNAISNPTAYPNTISPNLQTIWVVGENAAGCVHITSFDLIVNPLPVIYPLPAMNGCSDGVNPNQAPFDLPLNNPIVTGGAPGYTVSYHETQAEADNPSSVTLPTPYIGTDGQIIIVRVVDNATGCYITTTLQLNVTQGPVANTPTPLTYCDPNNDGFGEFNLEDALNDISGGPTPAGVNVTFHETPEDALLVTNAIDTSVLYNNIVENQQTIYVSVSYDLTGCANYTELVLIVNPTPEIVSPANPLEECDDAVADGYTQFDLTQVESEVLNGIDPTTVTISYYLTEADANVPTNAIVSTASFTNTSNPQTIYIRVQYTATGCYSVESFELVVNPLPIMPIPEDIVMSLCDVNNSGDQVEFFDLESQIPLIVNGQTNMIVTFHPTQADAINNTNALTSPYQNTSNAQSIFVRMENGDTGCFDTVIMDLRVEPLPVLVLPEPVEECGANQDGFAIFDLTALEADMLNGATDITLAYYETYTDADTQSNPIGDPSAYQNNNPFTQIIYVRAENTLTGCFTIGMIELIAHPSPIMPELDDLILCDTNYDGHAYFDLSQQSPIILAANTISPLDIRYYTTALDAQNGTNAIVNIASFYNTTNPQTIWVVASDPATGTVATGCRAVGTFDLIVNIPVDVRNQNNKLTLCDESLPNDQYTEFDLTVMDNQILGSAVGTATLIYYPSLQDAQNGTNAITVPTAYTNILPAVQTLGVVVTSADGCKSITTLTIRVEPLPTPNQGPYAAIEVCDDDQTMIGTELFDLTVNQTTIADGYPNLTFTYYANQSDYDNGIEIPDPTAYEGPTSTIIIAVKNNRVDYLGENCAVLVYQPIQVNPLPVVADTTYVLCDDDSDGMATFILSDYNAQLLGTTQLPADFTVTYYDSPANAQGGTTTGLLPDAYNGTNLETIYPRVVNNATGCVTATAEVTLSVKLRAVANPISQATLDMFTVCDYYNANDGVEVFDLTLVEPELLGTQTVPPITITYHLTPADQATGANPITNTTAFENTSNPQIIYIRVDRANDDPLDTTPTCYDVAEITLQVELLGEPVVTSTTGSQTICVDYNTGALITGLTLDSGIPSGSGYTYQWALNGVDITDGTGTGATYDITIAAPGDYTVVVTSTSPQGCVSSPSAPFTVIQSGPAANVQSFVTGAFEEMQIVTIVNDGYGVYHYQLDDGPIVDNGGVFDNVPAGEHTVTVYDVRTNNPCDAVTISNVSIINYPHFFTPNGDGINDTWQIKGLGSQSNAKIYIFDRYGKLLKQISATGEGWNGIFNGQPLPSTDYWFTVDYYEITVNGQFIPKQFKAHFTLKR